MEAKLNRSIGELRLSVRAANCMEAGDINSVRDLVQRTEDDLMEIRNFGETTLVEIRQVLDELGLHLGMKVPQAPVIN